MNRKTAFVDLPPRLLYGLTLLLGVHAAAAQIDQLPHPDTTAGNFFGVAVSIDGTRALVGASGEHSCTVDAGAAYVFEQNVESGRWHRVARLTASDCAERRFFGRSLELSGDRALITATSKEGVNKGPDIAYVFERGAAGAWFQSATITTDQPYPDATTGTVVALQGDQAVLTTWGDTSNGRYSGASYVFRFDPETKRWNHVVRLSGSGGVRRGIFGGHASLDRDRIAVPSSRYLQNKSGSLYIYERTARDSWKESARIDQVDDFFISADIDGDQLLVGESRAGSGKSGVATLFSRNETGQWHQSAELTPPAPYRHGAFGSEVALHGDRALVAGFDEQLKLNFNIDRVVYVYVRDKDTGNWRYQSIIDIGHVAFASAIDLHGNYALIGAAAEDVPGAAYIVRIP